MSDEEEIVWELLPSRRDDKTWFNVNWQTLRAKVPGGWLVMVIVEAPVASSPSVTFYPDLYHNWNGGSLE